MLALGLVAAVVRSANRPADPYLAVERGATSSTFVTLAPRGARAPFEAFAQTSFTVAGGELQNTGQLCALLADTAVLQAKGMMDRSDFAGYDGMVFAFRTESSGMFFMRNTRVPLSIAFFDSDGAFISSADMEPCPDDVVDCPLFGSDRPYRYAIEVPKGALVDLGIGPGSTLALGSGGCTA